MKTIETVKTLKKDGFVIPDSWKNVLPVCFLMDSRDKNEYGETKIIKITNNKVYIVTAVIKESDDLNISYETKEYSDKQNMIINMNKYFNLKSNKPIEEVSENMFNKAVKKFLDLTNEDFNNLEEGEQ